MTFIYISYVSYIKNWKAALYHSGSFEYETTRMARIHWSPHVVLRKSSFSFELVDLRVGDQGNPA